MKEEFFHAVNEMIWYQYDTKCIFWPRCLNIFPTACASEYKNTVKLLLRKVSAQTFLFNSETILLCQICNAIAQGYMQPWIPALPTPPTASATPSKDKSEKTEKVKGRQSGKGAKGGQSKGSLQTVTIDPEATPDLKQALDVRELFHNNLVHVEWDTWKFCSFEREIVSKYGCIFLLWSVIKTLKVAKMRLQSCEASKIFFSLVRPVVAPLWKFAVKSLLCKRFLWSA